MLKIEDSEFGKVTVDGNSYDHDIVIFHDKIIRRKKWITKEKHGTSHKFTRDEMEDYMDMISDSIIDEVIVGTGQYGKLSLLPETRDYLDERDIRYREKKTANLVGDKIDEENTMLIIHVTC